MQAKRIAQDTAFLQVSRGSRRAEKQASAFSASFAFLVSAFILIPLVLLGVATPTYLVPYYGMLITSAVVIVYCEFSSRVSPFWRSVATLLTVASAAAAVSALALALIALSDTVLCFTSLTVTCVQETGLAGLGNIVILAVTAFLAFSIYVSIQAIEEAYQDELARIYDIVTNAGFSYPASSTASTSS